MTTMLNTLRKNTRHMDSERFYADPDIAATSLRYKSKTAEVKPSVQEIAEIMKPYQVHSSKQNAQKNFRLKQYSTNVLSPDSQLSGDTQITSPELRKQIQAITSPDANSSHSYESLDGSHTRIYRNIAMPSSITTTSVEASPQLPINKQSNQIYEALLKSMYTSDYSEAICILNASHEFFFDLIRTAQSLGLLDDTALASKLLEWLHDSAAIESIFSSPSWHYTVIPKNFLLSLITRHRLDQQEASKYLRTRRWSSAVNRMRTGTHRPSMDTSAAQAKTNPAALLSHDSFFSSELDLLMNVLWWASPNRSPDTYQTSSTSRHPAISQKKLETLLKEHILFNEIQKETLVSALHQHVRDPSKPSQQEITPQHFPIDDKLMTLLIQLTYTNHQRNVEQNNDDASNITNATTKLSKVSAWFSRAWNMIKRQPRGRVEPLEVEDDPFELEASVNQSNNAKSNS